MIAQLLDAERARFEKSPIDAERVVAVGEYPVCHDLDPVEQAAWTQIAALLLNLSEVLTDNSLHYSLCIHFLLTLNCGEAQLLTRRSLLGSSTVSLGAFALGNLLTREKADAAVGETKSKGLPELPTFCSKAKRVIYLFQSGGPSHVDLFDYHEAMDSLHGTDLPDSVRGGQRLTGMTSRQKSFPVVKPLWVVIVVVNTAPGSVTLCRIPSLLPMILQSSGLCGSKRSIMILQ